MMNRNRKLLRNTSFIVIGNIGSKLIGFIMLPLYTNWLSPADYGLASLLTVYASLLLNVIACDVSDAIYIFPIGATQDKVKTYYSTGFFFQVFCCAAALPLTFVLSQLSIEDVFFRHIWYIYAILVTALFQKYTQDFCRGINKMSVFSFTGIVQTFMMAGLSLALIPQMGVYGFVIATITSNIATAMFTFIYSKSYQYLSLRAFSIASLKEMLHFSLPLIPTAILWWLVSGLNRPILEEYTGLFSIGLLAVAMKLPSIVNLTFGFFQQAWIVTVVEEYKKPQFDVYFNKMFRMIFAVQAMACMVITMAGKPFIHLMTTDDYYSAYLYIPLLTIGAVFSNISAFLGTAFSANRKTGYTFYTAIFGGFTALTANLLLIPHWGLLGACLSIVLAHIASALSRIVFSNKFVHFTCGPFILKQMLPIAICTVTSLTSSSLWLYTGYLCSVILYWLINKNDLKYAVEVAGKKIHWRLKRI